LCRYDGRRIFVVSPNTARLVCDPLGVPGLASTDKTATHHGNAAEEIAAKLGSLTLREREVLELMQVGITNAEIAGHLFIAAGTVRKHLENAFLKLGVHTRTQAAALMNAARELPAIAVPEDRPRELPRYLTNFIGRQREVSQLKDLLHGTRLLTLTGAGGVGKTRLALHVAEDLATHADVAAWFVDLASVGDPSLVRNAVASALGLREQPGYDPRDTLIHFLRTRRMVLVLDNCEHVLGECAELGNTLLHACPELRILATSRQPLGIAGEAVYPVPSLSVPDADRLPAIEELIGWEAVRLLVERARAVQPGFRLTHSNAPLVVQTCRRLDGIPLAIELTAALVRTRPLELIVAGLSDRFRTVVSGNTTAVPRHQTLRATVEWSHDLLSDHERALLRRLSVFLGSFSAEAVDVVCAGDYGEAGVVDLLARLVDKSLVILDSDGLGGRYRLLETVRDYGRERLADSGDADAVRSRHRDWYLGLVERAGPHLFGGAQQADWLSRLDAELDNLRAALEWSQLDPRAPDTPLRLAVGLWRFWEIRGYLAEGRKWLEPALAETRGAVSELRANGLTGAGILAFMQGDHAAAFAFHEESLALHRQLGNAWSVAYALSNLGNVALELSDYKRARACHEEAARLHEMLGNDLEEAGTSLHLAEILDRQGEQDKGSAMFEASLATIERLIDRSADAGERAFVTWTFGYALSMYASAVLRRHDLAFARQLALHALFVYREVGDAREGARVLALLADIADAQGDPGAATALLLEALATRHGTGDRPGIAATLERLASVFAPIDVERAGRMLGAAAALRGQMGTPLPTRDRAMHDEVRSTLLRALGRRRLEAALETGRLQTLTEVVADASAIADQEPEANGPLALR
jgi:predicted ATPase/DNA-binding CsgD family transcriptional regulator